MPASLTTPNFNAAATDGALIRQADGTYLALWASGAAIKGQVFTAEGVKLGDELTIFTGTGAVTHISAAALQDESGRTILTWMEEGAIRKVVLNADHMPHGLPELVQWTGSWEEIYGETAPRVYALENGGYSILYQGMRDMPDGQEDQPFHLMQSVLGDGSFLEYLLSPNDSEHAATVLTNHEQVLVFRYSDSIQVHGTLGDTIINRTSTEETVYHSVTALAQGEFIVTWQDDLSATDSTDVVRALVFNATHTAKGDLITFSKPPGTLINTTVSQLSDGSLVLVLTMNEVGDRNIYVATCSATGTVSEPILVGQSTEGLQTDPTIIALDGGKFVVGWTNQFDGQEPQFMTEVFGTSTAPENEFPELANLHGDSVTATPGGTALLDVGSNAELTDDQNAIASLVVHLWDGDDTDHLGIRTEENGIQLSDGLNPQSKIFIGTKEIGEFGGVSDQWLLHIQFNPAATVVDVQQLIRALTYINSSSDQGLTSERHIQVRVVDGGNKSIGADITVNVAPATNNAAPQVTALDGDVIDTTSGMTVLLDVDSDAIAIDEDPYYLSVNRDNSSSDDYFGIRTEGTGIHLSDGMNLLSIVSVQMGDDLVAIGEIVSNSNYYLDFQFYSTTTAAQVQKLIHALTYTTGTVDTAFQNEITIYLEDRTEQSAWAKVTVNVAPVAPVNTAPHTILLNNATSVAVNENTSVIGILSATDDEGNTITGYTITDGNAAGIFEVVKNTLEDRFEIRVAAGKTLDYEAITDATKAYALNLKATDQHGATTATAETITINLIDVNDLPCVIVAQGTATTQATDTGANVKPFTGVTFADQDHDEVIVTIEFDVAGGDLVFSWTPDRTFDPDTNTVSYFFIGTKAQMNELMQSLEFNPAQSSANSGTLETLFTITVADGTGPVIVNEAVKVVTTMTDKTLNEAPTITWNAIEVMEGEPTGTVVGTLTANDPEGQPLTYTLVDADTSPFMLQERAEGGYDVIFRQPMRSLDFETPAHRSFSVIVSDDVNAVTQTLALNLVNENENPMPYFTGVQASEGEGGGTVVGTITATDEENDPLTYTIVNADASPFTLVANPDGGYDVVVKQGVTLDYELPAHRSVRISVSDGVNSYTATYQLNITDVPDGGNQPPLIGNLDSESVSVSSGQTVFLDANRDANLASDEGLLSFFEVSITGHVNGTEGHRLGVDTSGRVRLSNGLNFESKITVDVTDNGIEDGVEIGDVGYLSGGDSLRFELNGNATPARVQELVRALTYHNTKGSLAGPLNVNFYFEDAVGRHAEANVTVLSAEAPANHAPTSAGLSRSSVLENAAAGTLVGTLSALDPDAGDTGFTYTLLDDAGGRFGLSTDGKSIVVNNGSLLDYETAQSHTIRVKAIDPHGASTEQVLSITVGDVMEAVSGGTKGKNVLVGGVGADKLNGGAGNDKLTGGAGADVFVFDAKLGTDKTNKKVNFDTLTDFTVADDSIWLDNAIFKKLGKKGSEDIPAALNKKFFKAGTKAKDKDDYLVYNKKTGVLSYDVDGKGAKKAVEIAKFANKPALTADDFFIV